ncbi:Exocyst complex component 2, partial [Dissostichus eleginoides]
AVESAAVAEWATYWSGSLSAAAMKYNGRSDEAKGVMERQTERKKRRGEGSTLRHQTPGRILSVAACLCGRQLRESLQL